MKLWMLGLGSLLLSNFASAEGPTKGAGASDSPVQAAKNGDLAAQLEEEASVARSEAEKHRKIAEDFKKEGGPQITKWQLDVHCKNISQHYEKIAKEKKA